MTDTAKEVLVLRKLHSDLKSWKKVAEELGLNSGDCWRVAKEERGVPPGVIVAVDFWLRCERASDSAFIRVIRRRILPCLAAREQFERKTKL